MTEERQPDSGSVPSSVMTVTEFTGLVALVQGMLNAAEARILTRISEAVAVTDERWKKHDRDAERVLEDWDTRFGGLEGRVTTHLRAEEIQEKVWDARVGPIRNGLHYLILNWKALLLFLFTILGFIAVAFDILSEYLPHLFGGGA